MRFGFFAAALSSVAQARASESLVTCCLASRRARSFVVAPRDFRLSLYLSKFRRRFEFVSFVIALLPVVAAVECKNEVKRRWLLAEESNGSYTPLAETGALDNRCATSLASYQARSPPPIGNK